MTDQQPSPDKTPFEMVVEHATEAFVYAPIGILFEGASLLPELVEKGRSQVTLARMMGKFAVKQGRGEATKAAAKIQDQVAGVLDFIGGGLAPVTEPKDQTQRGARARTGGPIQPLKAQGAAQAAARRVAGITNDAARGAAKPSASTLDPSTEVTTDEPAPSAARAPSAAGLGIPDYDGLSASHVVNRLAGLSNDELEAVRAYEAANRGRKTILSKVAQLQSP